MDGDTGHLVQVGWLNRSPHNGLPWFSMTEDVECERWPVYAVPEAAAVLPVVEGPCTVCRGTGCCPDCSGSGSARNGTEDCRTCDGKGDCHGCTE